MRFVAISKRLDGFDAARAGALAADEAGAVWMLYQEGAVASFAFDGDRPDPKGILFIDAGSRAEAEAVTMRLPMAAEGLIGFDVYALGPYRALEMAFSND